MTPIDNGLFEKYVKTAESLLKTGEVHHAFAPIISTMAAIAEAALTTNPDISRNTLGKELLAIPNIDSTIESFEPDSYSALPQLALSSAFDQIKKLDLRFIECLSPVLSGQELNRWEELYSQVNKTNIELPADDLHILKIAEITLPLLIQDQEYAKEAKKIGSGHVGVDQWFVDFRTLKDNPNIFKQLLSLNY